MGELLTSDQAAERLHVQAATLRSWRHRGTGPAYVKVGRKVFYRPADLEAFLEAGLVQPAKEE